MMVVWYLTDGKSGHLNQVLGLLAALEKKVKLEVHELSVADVKANFISWLFGRIKVPQNIPIADLIIGAGHRTHWPLLTLAKKTNAKTLLLMRPSLPLFMFDFVCAPIHDRLPLKDNCFSTEGAINCMQSREKISNTGMILIGGPSAHAKWNSDLVIKQLTQLIENSDDVQWVLTTSRRTPENFISKIPSLNNLQVISWECCEKNWLPEKMACTEQVWVTPDSVSMIYEALTAEAKVGVFQLKIIPTRVSMGIEELVNDNILADFAKWKCDGKWTVNAIKLNEAERCASWILENMELAK